MKLMLTANGIRNVDVADEVARLVGKPREKISIAVLNEASAVGEDHRWIVSELNDLARFFPGPIQVVNISSLPFDHALHRLEVADVIFALGGESFWFDHVLRQTGVAETLPQLLEKTVYIGSSAGAIVMCQRSTHISPDANWHAMDLEPTDFFGFANLAIVPHTNSPIFPEWNTEFVAGVDAAEPFPIFGVADGGAISIVDGEVVSATGTPLAYDPR